MNSRIGDMRAPYRRRGGLARQAGVWPRPLTWRRFRIETVTGRWPRTWSVAMTLADWCLFGAIMLYLITLAPIKAIGRREFDNANPRATGFYRPAIRSRALGAHLNGIETYPFFATAVLLAEF